MCSSSKYHHQPFNPVLGFPNWHISVPSTKMPWGCEVSCSGRARGSSFAPQHPTKHPRASLDLKRWVQGLEDLPHTHTIHGTGIYTYMDGWLFMVNVGKYTSPMDPMGYAKGAKKKTCRNCWNNYSMFRSFLFHPISWFITSLLVISIRLHLRLHCLYIPTIILLFYSQHLCQISHTEDSNCDEVVSERCNLGGGPLSQHTWMGHQPMCQYNIDLFLIPIVYYYDISLISWLYTYILS